MLTKTWLNVGRYCSINQCWISCILSHSDVDRNNISLTKFGKNVLQANTSVDQNLVKSRYVIIPAKQPQHSLNQFWLSCILFHSKLG